MEPGDSRVIEHMKKLASYYKIFFDSLRDVGFTTEQSFELVKAEASRPAAPQTGRR